MKRITAFIVINGLAVLLMLLALEGLVRLAAGDRVNFQGTSAGLYQDSVYQESGGWKAGAEGVAFGASVHINTLGMRGPELRITPAKRIILLLGDSVLFGVGVEQDSTIPARLQARFAADSLLLLNTSVIGYSLWDYRNVLEYWLERVQPEQVILFYTLNDIYRGQPKLMAHRQVRLLEAMLSFLRNHSKAYLWLKDRLMDRAAKFFQYDYDMYRDPQQLDRVRRAFRALDSLSREHQQGLEVVLLPYRRQFAPETPDPWLPQREIGKILEELAIPYRDARKAFAGKERIEEFYLFGDAMHFSARGCREIAEFISRNISSPE